MYLSRLKSGGSPFDFDRGMRDYADLLSFKEFAQRDYERNIELDREIVKLLYEEVSLGQPDAPGQLGLYYDFGWGVEKDEQVAMHWYQVAAEQEEDAMAELQLGKHFRYGWSVPEDPEQAQKWFHRAAHHNSAEAQYILGEYYYALGGMSSSAEAAGDRKARESARLLAVKWFRSAAEQGHVAAQYNLNWDDFGGCSGLSERDDEEARYQWIQRAAKQGHAGAQEGQVNWAGDREINVDDVRWLRLAAAQGHVGAMNQLSWIYEEGLPGVFRADAGRAKVWDRLAAKTTAELKPYYWALRQVEGRRLSRFLEPPQDQQDPALVTLAVQYRKSQGVIT